MSWLGKVVGGTIGFAIGGPVGAVAGAAFGHMFDAENIGPVAIGKDSNRLSNGETAQMTFFVASFSMLAKLIRSDGQVTEPEIQTVRQFMVDDLHLNAQSRLAAEHIFRAALDSKESFENFAGQFFQHFNHQPQLLELMIDILFRVALADGALNAVEERLIKSAAEIFKFSNDAYLKFKSRYTPDSDKYYKILGCSNSDSDDKIKSQYRKLVRDYHPDTIASKGLPEEFVTFAHEKFREIQEAYEMVKKDRGL
ncbi:MAG: DnaJ domain-containing protein [Desulfobacteraceae bacterium]|nr:TerB family tellurite resistance protein [Desulfobacteraceae bacterium]MBC2755668.1 DnaJ domain-containing protein [Desulfobacteraceae bacterium]